MDDIEYPQGEDVNILGDKYEDGFDEDAPEDEELKEEEDF